MKSRFSVKRGIMSVKCTAQEWVLGFFMLSVVLLLAGTFYTEAVMASIEKRIEIRVSKTMTDIPTFDDMFMFVLAFAGLLGFALILYLYNLSLDLAKDRERVKKLIERVEEREKCLGSSK